jgi:hypothetical protein
MVFADQQLRGGDLVQHVLLARAPLGAWFAYIGRVVTADAADIDPGRSEAITAAATVGRETIA